MLIPYHPPYILEDMNNGFSLNKDVDKLSNRVQKNFLVLVPLLLVGFV